ncbi:hypothetical protein [Falsiroseomonas oryzae]|uniref:hypothetical protein n=1 Tax=Falsiroseomonas oryzae TaxID=2766473 RepID=UPI0022EAD80E|nr:hypothetical protein [Roseomonas sp. MO-31]
MRRRLLLLAAPMLPALTGAAAQEARPADRPAFIEVMPAEGRMPVRIATGQVVRIGRAEGHTVLDTTAWVQQRTVEPVDSVARRLLATGLRLVPLTDLANGRIWLAADRVVLVREAHERHAAGARAAIVMVGLRFGTDVAVRESVAEVMAALEQ